MKQNKVLNFALVCMQIAYPFIYNQLTEVPDFKQWNESIAAKLKLRPLTEGEKQSLDAAEEFDEDWEKVLFRMCQKEIYLSNRAFQVSLLMNKIAEIVNDDANLGAIVESTLELSAVTNLKAFDTPKKLQGKKSAIVGDFSVEIMTDNKVVVKKGGAACDNTKAALREIAEKVGFAFDPKWNTQQLGNKLANFINQKQ